LSWWFVGIARSSAGDVTRVLPSTCARPRHGSHREALRVDALPAVHALGQLPLDLACSAPPPLLHPHDHPTIAGNLPTHGARQCAAEREA
jgi:hypothetical protein